jgi:hypothetical protein
MDINRENYELGLPCIEKAGVAHKIDFREGPALPVLDDLIADVRKNTARPILFLSGPCPSKNGGRAPEKDPALNGLS